MSKYDDAAKIIHTAAAACTGTATIVGFIPGFGGFDAPALTAIHTAMIKELAELFDVKPTAAEIAKVLGLFVGSQFGTALAKTLLSFLPGIGGFANGAITAAHTEAFGWIAYKYFEENY